MKRPNLFIVGAMKAGTSSLHNWLGLHPAVYMSKVKEPAFFVDPKQEDPAKAKQQGYWNDSGAYLQLFEGANGASWIGESTTDYTKAPKKTGCAARINAFNPDARIIYLVRDPVERAVSHYWWNVGAGDEKRDMARAFERDPFYCDVSDYAMQIAPYFTEFGADRVRIVSFERLRDDAPGCLAELYAWMGLESFSGSPTIIEAANVTPEAVVRRRGPNFLHTIRYSRAWNACGGLVHRRLRSWARGLTEKPIARHQVNADAAKETIRPRMIDAVARFEALIQRQFPEWTSI